MDKKFCPKCNKDVETVWKFSRERCVECKEPLDKDPIDHKIYVPLGVNELNRRQVINMQNKGMF
jgi:hypothetical protein